MWARKGWSVRNDPLAFSREEFVRGAHEEDTAAAVQRILANIAMQRSSPAIPDAPGQQEYQAGYRSVFVRALEAELSVEEQHSAAEHAGRTAVYGFVVDNNFRRPGADWDVAAAHNRWESPTGIHSPGVDLNQSESDWIDLYHGTDARWAALIRANGVHANYPRYRCDFGEGFYLTRLYEQAAQWASWHPNPAVLHYRLNKQDLAALDSKAFSEYSHDLPDFVRHYCTGGGGRPHDVIEGPILLNPMPSWLVKPQSGAETRWHFTDSPDLCSMPRSSRNDLVLRMRHERVAQDGK